jgi:transcriptional regulator with GAF, ATPase, and Fis domain
METDDAYSDDTTIARPAVRIAEVPGIGFRLTVIDGPSKGSVFSIDASAPSRVLIGKSPVCEVRLSDQEVSRRHAAFEIVETRLELTDLDSTNGTRVDGVAVAKAYLGGGETVRLGKSALRVERTEQTPGKFVADNHFGRVRGQSARMRRLYPLLRRIADSDVPILIEGETGTGKEHLAEALHEQGPRAKSPLVVFDCTAVAPNMIESELFGHERGAFTGAVSPHRGVFERANHGTLLIDEIGELPLELQPKLLRAIERSELTRIGGEREIRVDVRLMFATRRDLDQEVQKGRFRDDLFHRIAVARVELPPLRARRADIPLLATLFCSEFGADPQQILTEELLGRWQDQAWPGNVRELRNTVLRRVALGELQLEPLEESEETHSTREARPHVNAGDPIARILALELPLDEARGRMVEEFERRYLEQVLAAHGGSVTRAAVAAGIARRHFHRLKSRYLRR